MATGQRDDGKICLSPQKREYELELNYQEHFRVHKRAHLPDPPALADLKQVENGAFA